MREKLYKAGLWLCLLGITAEITVVVIQAMARLFTNGLAFNMPLIVIAIGLIIASFTNK